MHFWRIKEQKLWVCSAGATILKPFPVLWLFWGSLGIAAVLLISVAMLAGPDPAEWEFAARGGLESKRYGWGDDFRPGELHMANTWQGVFPVRDTGEDEFVGTSPVGSFPTNGYGLYDMTGNVWQWCSEWYRVDAHVEAATQNFCRDPAWPAQSYDPIRTRPTLGQRGLLPLQPLALRKLSPQCAQRLAPPIPVRPIRVFAA
jgi:hypothetical protein